MVHTGKHVCKPIIHPFPDTGGRRHVLGERSAIINTQTRALITNTNQRHYLQEGGVTSWASSSTIINTIREEEPELLPVLAGAW